MIFRSCGCGCSCCDCSCGCYACGCYESCGLSGGKCDTEAGCTKLQNEVTALKDKVAALVQEKDKVEFLPPNSACVGAGTSLFLVGDNFSVHDTKVIAGGVCIPHVQLISRELMRVTIPSCVNRVTLCEDGVNRPYVPVYVATPYGVTNHLHIPVWGTNSDTSAPADGGCCPGNPTPAEPDCPEEIPMPTFMRAFPDNGPDGSLRLVRDASWDVEPTRFLLVADEGDATTPAPGSTATDPTPTDPPAPDPVVERLIRIEQMLNDKAVGGELQALTVNVSSPDVVVDTGEDRSHGHNHPLLQQMKTRTQECWRNVRDQLPGY